MDCYTVGSIEVVGGLYALQRDGNWVVRVGFNPNTEVPVSRRKRETIDRFMNALEQRASGDTRFINLLDADEPVTQEQAKEALDEIGAGGLGLFNLDWDAKSGRLIDSRGPVCLTLVHACANHEEATLAYFANSFDEMVKDGRTVKVNRPFNQAAGVEVCAQGVGFFGEPHALVRMLPRSSFRMRQSHPMTGSWSEMVLSWNGRQLRSKTFQNRPREPQKSRQ